MSKAFMKEESAEFTLPPTRRDFLVAYAAVLHDEYQWTHDITKFNRFIESVNRTLDGKPGTQWNHKGECVTRAWRSIGGKGVPSLRQLRNLP